MIQGAGQETPQPDAKIALLDKNGKRIPVISDNKDFKVVFNGNIVAQEMTLTYPSRNGDQAPDKLVVLDRRTLVIDVPFSLKNVAFADARGK